MRKMLEIMTKKFYQKKINKFTKIKINLNINSSL